MDLTTTVQREVEAYNKARVWKGKGYSVADQGQQLYAVITVPDLPRPHPARVVVMARVVGDKVVIDEDTTDRPLYEALMHAGIPREKIVLLYAGETLSQDNP